MGNVPRLLLPHLPLRWFCCLPHSGSQAATHTDNGGLPHIGRLRVEAESMAAGTPLDWGRGRSGRTGRWAWKQCLFPHQGCWGARSRDLSWVLGGSFPCLSLCRGEGDCQVVGIRSWERYLPCSMTLGFPAMVLVFPSVWNDTLPPCHQGPALLATMRR